MIYEQARADLVDTCVAMADAGFLAGTGGNLARRVGPEHFLVTPSATDYYAMGPADICVMRLADTEQVAGDKMASVESGLHARVLQARPDCTVSVHTPQPIASAYTLLGRPLRTKNVEISRLLGETVPCVAYAPSGTGELAQRVADAFDAATHACLMRNHGVVCVGRDMDEGRARVAALEAACAEWFTARLEKAEPMPALTEQLPQNHPRFSGTPSARFMKAQIETMLLKDVARFRAKGLYGNPEDSFSIRVPGRSEFFMVQGADTRLRRSIMDASDGVAALHAHLYRARPDAGALLLGRSPWCTALAALNATIPLLFDEQARHIGKVEASVAAGDLPGLEEAVAGGANVAIVGGQRLCLGVTPERIVLNAELFEKCAKAFVIAHSSGAPVKCLPEKSCRFYIQRMLDDQARAAASLAAGRIPEGMNAY